MMSQTSLTAIRETFAAYRNIQLVVRLIEMKQATMPVSGLRAWLAPGTFPLKSSLAPVLEADGVLAINRDTLAELAAKMGEVSIRELEWLDRTLSGLAKQIAAEEGTSRA